MSNAAMRSQFADGGVDRPVLHGISSLRPTKGIERIPLSDATEDNLPLCTTAAAATTAAVAVPFAATAICQPFAEGR